MGEIWGFEVACVAAAARSNPLPPLSLEAVPSLSLSHGVSAQKFYLMFTSRLKPLIEPLPDCAHCTAAGTPGPLSVLLPGLPGLCSRDVATLSHLRVSTRAEVLTH